jgi:hypothetical protein
VLREVKYNALPKPVRSALGTVPRHSDVMGFGPERILRSVPLRVEKRDCWTRVLRRSAGWRRTALETPLARPARKWNVGWADLGGRGRAGGVLPWDIGKVRVRWRWWVSG